MATSNGLVKTAVGLVALFAGLVGALVMPTAVGKAMYAYNVATLKVSDDVANLSLPSDMDGAPLPQSDPSVKTSGAGALKVALANYGFPESSVDFDLGVVRSVISFKHDQVHQNMKVWLVTFDVVRRPTSGGGEWQKYAVAIDTATGQPVFSFPFDFVPSSGTSANP